MPRAASPAASAAPWQTRRSPPPGDSPRSRRARVRSWRAPHRTRPRCPPHADMRGRHGRHAAWLLLGCLLLLPVPARASYEEFSTFSVGKTEDDDEFLFDQELVRSPADWHGEFDQALNAFRSSQGCFTAGQWHVDNELKVQVPLGDTARFVLD